MAARPPRPPWGGGSRVLRGRKRSGSSRGADTRFRATPFSSLPRRDLGAGTAVQTGSETPGHGAGAAGKTRRGGRDRDGRFGARGYSQAMPLPSPGLAVTVGGLLGAGGLGDAGSISASALKRCASGQAAG